MNKIIKTSIILLILLLTIGCTTNNNLKNNKTGMYHDFNININVLNDDASNNEYLLFLLPKGIKKQEVGEGTLYSGLGKYEIKENKTINFNFIETYELQQLLEETEDDVLELYITTKEDKYIRNPLNDKTEIKFIKNEFGDYYSPYENINVNITDSYPEGVISLPYQDAHFVIKLNYSPEYDPGHSYEVSIHWNDPKKPDKIGIYSIGKVAREFYYWETPFYKTEKLESKTGKIIVRHFSTDEIIEYEGYPKTISFDKDGNCLEGNIILLNMNNE